MTIDISCDIVMKRIAKINFQAKSQYVESKADGQCTNTEFVRVQVRSLEQELAPFFRAEHAHRIFAALGMSELDEHLPSNNIGFLNTTLFTRSNITWKLTPSISSSKAIPGNPNCSRYYYHFFSLFYYHYNLLSGPCCYICDIS